MNQKYAKLFEPVKIGKLTIKNRTSMAPMGLVCYADENGGFNEEAREYYVERLTIKSQVQNESFLNELQKCSSDIVEP